MTFYNDLCQGKCTEPISLPINPVLGILNGTDTIPNDNENVLMEKVTKLNKAYAPSISMISSGSHPIKGGFVLQKIENTDELVMRAKKEKTTVGMALLAVVYAVTSELENKTPQIDVLVDLRTRLETKDTLILNNLVGVMFSIIKTYDVNVEEEFWNCARFIHKQLLLGLEKKEHFEHFHVLEKLLLAGGADLKDMCFSNLGCYKYPTQFPESGVSISSIYLGGNGIVPYVGGQTLLEIITVNKSLCFTLVFENCEENRQLATSMLDSIVKKVQAIF